MKKSTLIISHISTLLLISFFLCPVINGQIINTIAGTGVGGFSGDGGAATAAKIYNPTWVTTDVAGNCYFADRSNHVVRKISTLGIITTVAGTGGVGGYSGDGGPATAAKLQRATSVAFDVSGNMYISDYDNNRIRKVNSSGIISTFAGTGIGGFSGNGGPATAAQFNHPYGLVFDGAGNLFVADEYNHCIRKISPSGIITHFAGTGGVLGFSGDGGSASSCEMYNPHYITLDVSGNMFVTDNSNHRIRKINTSGIINTYAGTGIAGYNGDGIPATSAQINWAGGLKVDASGNLYIADFGSNRIRIVSPSGIINTFAGTGFATFSGDGGPATAAGFNSPCDFAFDASGNLLIADYGNNRIRKIGAALTPSNHSPFFTAGASQTASVCENSEQMAVTILLATGDIDTAQTETWTVFTPPVHGFIAGLPSVGTSTGGTIYPSPVTYTPAVGYSGSDSFKVKVSDGLAADTITIYVTVIPLPMSDAISGTDTVCIGDIVTLTESVAGGTWNTTNGAISIISSTGVVTALSSGADSIIYTVTNACGTSTLYFPFYVRPDGTCTEGITNISVLDNNKITVFPNPNQGSFKVLLSSPLQQKTTLTVVDVTGKKIKEMPVTANNETEMQLHVPSGVYFISAITDNGTTTARIVVE